MNGNNVTYFDSLGVEYIPKEITKVIVIKNIIRNVYKIQAYDLIKLPNFKVRTKFFRNLFFPHPVNEWGNLDSIIKSSELYLIFRKIMLYLIIPNCNETYRMHNPTGLKLLTRLRIDLSHLNDHKFNQNLNDCINPLR